MQTPKPDPCEARTRSSSTGAGARCARCLCGAESAAQCGCATGWLPSREYVDEQRRSAWKQMRESSGFGETEVMPQIDGTDENAHRPWNVAGVRWALAFALLVWLAAFAALGVTAWS